MRRLLSIAVLGLLGAACSSDDRRKCAVSGDCQGLEQCLAGFCGVPDAGARAQLGQACLDDKDCDTSLGCLASSLGFSGGSCTRACNAATCPNPSVCIDLRNTSAGVIACMTGCNADPDCRSGYSCCKAYPAGNACVPTGLCPATNLPDSPDLGQPCAGNDNCIAGESCQTSTPFPGGACTHACVAGNPATCPSNARCVDTEAGAWCLKPCNVPGDCRAGAGYDCVPESAGSTSKVCRGSPQPCTPGELFVDGGTPTCTPGTTTATLVVGSGGAPVGPPTAPASCQKPLRCSALPAAQMQPLGIHAVGDTVTFNVPAGTAGLSIVSQAFSAGDTVVYQGTIIDNTVVPDKVKQPDGTVIWDENVAPPTGDQLWKLPAFYASGSPTTGVFTVPNTTTYLQQTAANGLPAGTWSFKVNDYAFECVGDPNCVGGNASGKYDIQVLTRPGPLPAKGVVDIAFYIVVGPATLTAQKAVGDAKVARMVRSLATIYASAGICVGTVSFFNVPTWAQNKYANGVDADRLGPCDNLDQMFTLSQPGNTLNFFLVQTITSSSQGGEVVGIDGTIPGPSTVGGTVHSGAAVSLSDLLAGTCTATGPLDISRCGADLVAYIAAHEGGHWLGLIHTSEATGDFFDTVSDTPICQCTSDCVGAGRAAKCGSAGGASPTLIFATDCRKTTATCQGADNLMFWQVDDSSVGNLSSQQAQVARANPLIR